MPQTYYTHVLHRLRFSELWRLSPGVITFVILVVCKIFRWNSRPYFGVGLPHLYQQISVDELPEHVRQKFLAQMPPWTEHDLTRGVISRKPTLGSAESFQIQMRSESGNSIIEVVVWRDWVGQSVNEKLIVCVASPMSDGQLFATYFRNTEVDMPDWVQQRVIGGSDVNELLRAHEQRLTELHAHPISLVSNEHMMEINGPFEKRISEYLLKRQLLRPLTDDEIRGFTATATDADERPDANSTEPAETEPVAGIVDMFAGGGETVETGNAEKSGTIATASPAQQTSPPLTDRGAIHAELERLRNQKPSWLKAIIVLFVTGGLFVGLGGAVWDWRFVLLLIPILLVHELGHFVAMKLFGYENVRMFFVPLFGAAVAGRSFNSPGWKRAIVSLMGPVPSILLTIPLGMIAVATGSELLRYATYLSLILNGLNLFPVLPLDGGWVAQTVIFARNQWMELGFRLVAAVFLLIVGALLRGPILLILGGIMLFSVPAAFKLTRIAWRLRREGIDTTPANDELIPDAAADRIISEVRREYPENANSRVLAQLSLTVFEQITTRPPGLLASIALLLLHAVSFVGAFVLAILFTAAVQVSEEGLFDAEPTIPISSIGIRKVVGAGFDEQKLGNTATRAVHYEHRPDADRSFADLASNPPDGMRATLLGTTILVELSADAEPDAEKRIDLLRTARSRIYEQTFDNPLFFSFEFRATGPAGGKHISNAIYDSQTEIAGIHLKPYWSPDRVNIEQQFARKTYAALTVELDQLWNDKLDLIEREIDALPPDEFDEQSEQLRGRQREILNKLGHEYLESQRGTASGIEQRVIDLIQQRPGGPVNRYDGLKPEELDEELANQTMQWLQRAGEMLGATGLDHATETPHDRRFDARMGAIPNGSIVQIRFAEFHNPVDGVPAFIRWLESQSCSEIRYGVGDLIPN